MIKKTIFTLLALCLCTTTMWAVGYNQTEWADSDRDAATVYTDSQTGLSFYVLNGDAVLTYAEASSSNYSSLTSLTLPETVSDGTSTYTVTKVGDYAFDHALTITGELVVPANILTLGRSAFEGCTGITSVTIEYAEENLANGNNQNWGTPFYSCSGITTVTLNRNLTQGRGAASGYRTELFSDLTNIETVYIGENVTEILHDLFNCNSSSSCKLATVYCYATTVPSLGSGAFDSHTGLTLYVYDEMVESFKNDTQTYSWPSFFSTIEGMGEEPEEEQPEGTLKDVTTGLYFEIDADGVVSIVADVSGVYTDDNLVKNDDGSYTLPSSVEDKGGTSGNVTRVGASAFEGASISGHLVIPATITAVGEMAFKSCTGLTEVTYEYSDVALSDESAGNNTGTQSFNGCSGVTTVHLNRDITIGRSGYLCAPFCYNTSVTTVYIGEYVMKIPDYMFRNTSTACLATVYCYASTPPTLGTAPFDNLASEHNLYVNYDDVNTYKANSSWEGLFGKANIHSLTGEDPDEPEDEYAFEYEGLWYSPIFDENDEVTENCEIIAPVEGEYSGEVSIPATATNETTGATYNVTRVDASAFANSSISGHLVIPATITAVGEKAFQNCTALTEVTYEYSETALKDESAGNNTGTQSFNGCSGVTTVHLNRDVTIGRSGYLCAPFCYNTSVTTVYIGEYVTKIPDYMFRNTSNACLSTVYSYASTPPTLGTAPFDNLASEHAFYTQAADLSKYKEDSSWTAEFGEENMFAYDAEESGDTFVCDVDPADKETISELSQVTFTNPNGGEILCNDDYPTYPEFNVYDEEGNLVTIMNNVTPVVENGLEVAQVLTFGYGDEDGNGYPSVVTEEGTYYVTVPAEIFIIYDENGNALYNEGMTLTYIVSADATEEPNYTLDIEPESGSTIGSLSTISISCEDGIMWNTLGWADVVVYDGNGDELDNEVTWEEVASSTGAITEVDLTISPTITIDGDYSVVIPKGYFLISGTIESKAITLEYTINENAGTETGIGGFSINDENVEGVYSTSGQKLNSTQKGVNIIRFSDGSVKKLYVK